MEKIYHKDYCVSIKGRECAYDAGAIRRIYWEYVTGGENSEIQVYFANGEMYWWESKWLNVYNSQFGIAVSFDGKYIFAQTWENGLRCLDSHTGETIWRTKSKRGITSIFVNEDTVLCHQHDRALQLLDIHTGEILAEKRPATAFDFTAIDHSHIVCQVTARRWEIIDAQTLETKEIFSHKDFTDGHIDYAINRIVLTENGRLKVCGFQNVWDRSVKPPVALPNLEFEHFVQLSTLG